MKRQPETSPDLRKGDVVSPAASLYQSPMAFPARKNLLLAVLLLFIYMKWHFGGLSYAAAFSVAILVLMHIPATRKVIPFLITLGLLALVHQLLVLVTLDRSWDRNATKFVIYMLTNWTILAIALFLTSQFTGNTTKVLFSILSVMVIMAIAEVLFGLRPVFDAVRSLYVSDNSLYTSVDRDVSQYGQLRAIILTSEPSSAGNFFGAVWLAYLVAGRNKAATFVWAATFLAAAIFLIRSPVLLSYLAVAPSLLIAAKGYPRSAALLLAVVLVAALWTFYFGWTVRNELPIPALAEFFSTGSFYIRQISPIQTTRTVLEISPLFGFGSEYFALAKQETADVLFSNFGGFYTMERIYSMPDNQFVTNAFWEFAGFWGLAGVLVFWVAIISFLRRIGAPCPVVLVLAFLILAINHAGILDAFTWTPLIFMVFGFTAASGQLAAAPVQTVGGSSVDAASGTAPLGSSSGYWAETFLPAKGSNQRE